MPDNAKPQPAKLKRGPGVPREPLWQLKEPHFERAYWWPEASKPDSEAALLQHPELEPEYDEKNKRRLRVAPIVWEVLRRHPNVLRIRHDLAEFVAPIPVHALAGEEILTIFKTHNFEIEYYLTISGLNAWVSRRQYDLNVHSMPSGTWLLDDRARARFELLMHSYVRQEPATIFDVEFRPETDLLEWARGLAEFENRYREEFPAWNQDGNPLKAIMTDPVELAHLQRVVDYYANKGYRISLTAHHPSPITHPAAVPQPFDRKEHLFFSVECFGDLLAFRDRLVNHKDPVSVFLWEELPLQLRRELLNLPAFLNEDGTNRVQVLLAGLCMHLTAIMVGSCIFTKKRFSEVRLSREIRYLIEADPVGYDLIRLNRILLEAAYPSELATSRSMHVEPVMHAKPLPIRRRPRVLQLVWIREVETNENCDAKLRKNYGRMLKNIVFPLLPSKTDGSKREALETPLSRIKDDLRKIGAIWESVELFKKAAGKRHL